MWYDGLRDGQANAPSELLARATAETIAAGVDPEPQDPRGNNRRARPGVDSPGRWDLILVGDDGLFLFNRSSEKWIVTPGRRAAMADSIPRSLPRVENEDAEWLSAIKGKGPALSSFDYAGPFTEVVLLGNLAARLNKEITWDANALTVANMPAADELIRTPYRPGWKLPVPNELL